MKIRILTVTMLTAFAFVGCDRKAQNLPLEEAMYQVPKPLVQQTLQIAPEPEVPAEEVRVADARWWPTATEYRLPESYVSAVGTAEQREFFSFAWDEPPYDRLLVRRADGAFQEYLELR